MVRSLADRTFQLRLARELRVGWTCPALLLLAEVRAPVAVKRVAVVASLRIADKRVTALRLADGEPHHRVDVTLVALLNYALRRTPVPRICVSIVARFDAMERRLLALEWD